STSKFVLSSVSTIPLDVDPDIRMPYAPFVFPPVIRKNLLFEVLKLKGLLVTFKFTVPPQLVMIIGLDAVPIIFLKVRLLVYLVAALKQIISPGFKPSALPSMVETFPGTM